MGEQVVNLVSHWGDQVGTAVQILAEKLGVLAGDLWAILVRQYIAEGTAHILWALLMFVAAFIAYRFIVRINTRRKELRDQWTAKPRNERDSEEDPTFGCWLGIVVLGIGECFLLYYGMDHLTEGVKMIINPGYYAAQEVLNLVKSMK